MRISFNMLCNSVSVTKSDGFDEDRNVVPGTVTEVTKVYVVYNRATNNGNVGKESSDRASLFYDVQNSRPLNFRFNIGDRVTFEGETLTVNSVSPYYNADGLQHYEIGLD